MEHLFLIVFPPITQYLDLFLLLPFLGSARSASQAKDRYGTQNLDYILRLIYISSLFSLDSSSSFS